MHNYKRIFLYATLFMILLGLSATYAYDITNDSNDGVSTQSDNNIDVDTTLGDVAIKQDVKDNNNIQKTAKDTVVEDKTIKKDSSINLNNDNLEDYFSVEDEYLIFNGDSSSENTLIQVEEDLNNQYLWLFDGEYSGITISTAEGVTLTNQAFDIYVNGFTFEGVTMEYTPDFMFEKAINVGGSDFSILGSNINYDPSVVDVGLNSLIHITGENSLIKDSTFTGTITTGGVDWDPFSTSDHEGLPQTVPIVIKGNYSDILNNKMIFSEKSCDGSTFPSFYGLTVSASYVNITNNEISITGTNGYVYTVYFTSTYNDISNNLISGNTITGSSVHNYTAGIYLEGSYFSNNTIFNNTIDVTCNIDEKPDALQDVVYAVVITDRAYMGANYVPGRGEVTDNNIINNTIVGSGHQIYAFEQFGGDNTLIEGNTIEITGSRANGLGVIGYNTTIRNNSIIVVGDTNQSEYSPDYVPPKTAGIQTLHGLNSTFANNTIVSTNGPGILVQDKNMIVTGNNIIVNDYDYTIETIGNATDCEISDNNLQSRLGVGSETTKDNGNNAYGDNFDDNTMNVTLDMDSISGTIGDSVEIFVWFTDIDSNIFDGETINIYANDELFKSLIIDESAVYDEFEIPVEWYKQNITLTAKFEGMDLYNPTEVSKVVDVKIPTSIITSSDDYVMAVGSSDLTITLKDIMDNDVDSSMSVYLNDELIDTAQSYTFTPSEVGTYNFNFVFEEATLDDGYTYTSSQKEFTIVVEAIATTITFDDMIVTQDKLTTINVNVQAVDSDVVVNEGIVEFTDVDNNVIATANVENGVATVDLTFDTVGENTLTAVFKDSTKFLTSTDSAVITVNAKGKLNTNVVVNPVEVEAGVETTIIANVTDENGNAVTKGKVAFKVNGKVLKDDAGKVLYVTVENGQAQITYTFPPNLIKNTTYITAVYSGSSDYNSAKSENTYITQVNSDVVISTSTLTGQINENITITANVSINNQPVNTGKVVIKINGKTVKDTNGKVIYALVQNGQVTVNYTIPSTLKAKDYIIEFVYISSNIRVEQNSTLTVTE